MNEKNNTNNVIKKLEHLSPEMLERYELTMERIQAIQNEGVNETYQAYAKELASFILLGKNITDLHVSGQWSQLKEEEKAEYNQRLYSDILPQHYEASFGNPSVCNVVFGRDLGPILSVLYFEVRSQIAYLYTVDIEAITIINELFIQMYNCLEQDEFEVSELKEILYWYASDYCDVFIPKVLQEQLDPECSIGKKIIMNANLQETSYLYDFGEYITNNELGTARYLQSQSKENIEKIARTIVNGFTKGFSATGKDLSMKSSLNIRYVLGFEIVVKRVVELFKEQGIHAIFYGSPSSVITKRKHFKSGYFGAIANKQYDYDHKDDTALFMDKKYMERKLDVTRNTYESMKELAAELAGPIVIETFGEMPFAPVENADALSFTKAQQKLALTYTSKGTAVTNQYIKPEERSYSIIAFPIPEIGEKYPEIFDAIVEVNTLDASVYECVQQTIIDALDLGTYVKILGKGKNRTDLRVKLQSLQEPEKETGFENCVADVNIPVGEVFTSPCLGGTTGVLHVSKVYLHELQYIDLEVQFKDGMIVDYSCGNFEDSTLGKKYIKENILNNHDTLPMGEFAIGTNTTAYEMAKRFNIEEKLPILIAEKMGPHFAVGDTCYSYSEDIKVYNPNGKEIIARENEISALRTTQIDKAYYHCHTDITIPYEEIKEITVCNDEGEQIKIIENGEFVLPGTQILNEPLYKLKL